MTDSQLEAWICTMVGGPLDGIITSKINAQLQTRLAASQIRVGIDTLFAHTHENALLDLIEPFIEGKEDEVAKLASEFLLAILVPNEHGRRFGATSEGDDATEAETPRKFAHRNARNRMIRHLHRTKGLTRAEAAEKMDALTPEQYDQALKAGGELPTIKMEGVSDWMSTILQFLKDHWVQILFAFLGLLMV